MCNQVCRDENYIQNVSLIPGGDYLYDFMTYSNKQDDLLFLFSFP